MTTKVSGTSGVDQVQDGIIAASKLSGNQSGGAPIFGARAWCVFDGTLTGTNAPIAGGNVTSVTRNGVGDYTINFTTAMQDANYAVDMSMNSTAGFADALTHMVFVNRTGSALESPTAASFRVSVVNAGSGAAKDVSRVCIVVYR